jgi:hypothetical protein
MANEQNLKPFPKGNNANPNGRPKRIYTILKESGYTKDDISTAFAEIGWQTLEDAEAIVKDPTKPLILKTVAMAFIKGATKGDFRYVSEILQHVIGKPKEQSENKHLHKIIVEYVNPTDTTLSSPSESGEDTE